MDAQYTRMIEALRHLRLVLQHVPGILGGAALQMQEFQGNALPGALVMGCPHLSVAAIPQPLLQNIAADETLSGFETGHSHRSASRRGAQCTSAAGAAAGGTAAGAASGFWYSRSSWRHSRYCSSAEPVSFRLRPSTSMTWVETSDWNERASSLKACAWVLASAYFFRPERNEATPPAAAP